MTISIIISVFNGGKTLEKCLQSILMQTYSNYELIVIDGGSDDDTLQIIHKYEKHITYWVSEKDKGVYEAFNKGLMVARGDWVYFLGADDFLFNEHALNSIANELTGLSSKYEVAYGNIVMVNKHSVIVSHEGACWEESKVAFKSYMTLPHQGLLTRKSYFEKYGFFDDSFSISGDYEMLLRGLLRQEPHYLSGVTVAAMGMGGLSGQFKNSLKAHFEARRAQKMHGIQWPQVRWNWALFKIFVGLLIRKLFGEQLGAQLIDRLRVWCGKSKYWTKA